ncbi:MAG TPA: Gfo/Idh/MocA family oxidoreductase [Gaiellales bacterium]|jgi:myo-inositol 2-dehydrogenase/D-chiro-inositol 1-dehydrogenase
MTRVLLCGAGQIGSLHAANLARAEGVSELVIADVDSARAQVLADRVSARAAPEGDPFAVAPDVLVVAAATPAHAGLVRQSIERGIPCFCEKPLSADLDETVELVREVERAGATVQVGFMRRFDPGLRAMRELIAGGGLGQVHTLHVASHDHEPPSEEYVARSGGMFRDQLIHDFDMIRWITASEVESVYAAGAVRTIDFAERYGDVDTCALVLTLVGGAFVLLAGTREDGSGEDVRIEAIGSTQSVAAGMNARTPLRLLDPIGVEQGYPPYTSAFDRFAAGYAAEMEHFLALAAGRGNNPCPPRDALGTLLVAVAAERSRAAGAPVAVQHADDLV